MFITKFGFLPAGMLGLCAPLVPPAATAGDDNPVWPPPLKGAGGNGTATVTSSLFLKVPEMVREELKKAPCRSTWPRRRRRLIWRITVTFRRRERTPCGRVGATSAWPTTARSTAASAITTRIRPARPTCWSTNMTPQRARSRRSWMSTPLSPARAANRPGRSSTRPSHRGPTARSTSPQP